MEDDWKGKSGFVGRVDVGGELYVGVEQGRSRAEKIVVCVCRGSQLKMEDDWKGKSGFVGRVDVGGELCWSRAEKIVLL